MDKEAETLQAAPGAAEDLSADEIFVRHAAAVLNASMTAVPLPVLARLDSIRQSAVTGAATGASAAQAGAVYRPSEPLPAEVTTRLDDIRAQALQRAAQQQQKQQQHSGMLASLRGWMGDLSLGLPAGAFASVCLLVTTLAIFNVREPGLDTGVEGLDGIPEPLPVAFAEDVLLLASTDEIELYENLEFYQWLAENGL